MCITRCLPFDEPPLVEGGGGTTCKISCLPFDGGTMCKTSCISAGGGLLNSCGIVSMDEILSSLHLIAATCNQDKRITASSVNSISGSFSSHCDVSLAAVSKVVFENVGLDPGASPAAASVQSQTRPKRSTSTIFTLRSEEMTKGYLMFSKDDPQITVLEEEPEDLTHLAPCMLHQESTTVCSDLGYMYNLEYPQQQTRCSYPPTTYNRHSAPVSVATSIYGKSADTKQNDNNQIFRISQRISPECGVCTTPFHSNVHNPRLLHCGHTICGSCVAHLIKIHNFFCPFCRASCTNIKSEKELPLNHFILDLVEKENTNICGNTVNNCLKNLVRHGTNGNLTSSNSEVIPSNMSVVHAGVCQEHGYYCDMRCTSCNINICKQCTYCDHPHNTCRVIPITNAKLENHIQFRAKEKIHAVMHNCKYITDNLLTGLPNLEAAAKRQARAVESLESELEFQQLLQIEVDDHIANVKDVLHEGHKKQKQLQWTQQYLEDLENEQKNIQKKWITTMRNKMMETKKYILETSCQTSINEAQSSDVNCSLSVEESGIVSISNKTEESTSNSVVKCSDSGIPELENTINLFDVTGNYSVKVSDNPEEIASYSFNVNTCSIPQNSKYTTDTTSNDSQISFEKTNDQATPIPDSMTNGTLPQINIEADTTQVQITNLEDVQKIQKETEHFILASQYLPWNRTASKLKKTQAIVFHAVDLLDLCHTSQGYAPVVEGFIDDDYESEDSEDDYDYDDENNSDEDADHAIEEENDDTTDSVLYL